MKSDDDDDDGAVYDRPTIVVHPLKRNKRPIGFAPWPQEKPAKKRRRGKKKKKRRRPAGR